MKKLCTVIVVFLLTICYCISSVYSQNVYTLSFNLLTQKGFFTLKLEISEELYNYYVSKSHLYTENTLDKFVTPYVFNDLVLLLNKIVVDEEEFVNTALMIVHQLTYNESNPLYPVETLVLKQGDCDTFSYVLASILIQAKFDTILIVYDTNIPKVKHMNVAVALPSPPKNARMTPYYFLYNNKTFYVCETTGDKWQDGWRVGELPSELIGSTYKILVVNDYETTSIGTIYAYVNEALQESKITVNVIPFPSYLIISGSLEPKLEGEEISIFSKVYLMNSYEYLLAKVKTNSDGCFEYKFVPLFEVNVYSFRVSWSGNNEYKGCVVNLSFFNIDKFIIFPFYLWLLPIIALAKSKKR